MANCSYMHVVGAAYFFLTRSSFVLSSDTLSHCACNSTTFTAPSGHIRLDFGNCTIISLTCDYKIVVKTGFRVGLKFFPPEIVPYGRQFIVFDGDSKDWLLRVGDNGTMAINRGSFFSGSNRVTLSVQLNSELNNVARNCSSTMLFGADYNTTSPTECNSKYECWTTVYPANPGYSNAFKSPGFKYGGYCNDLHDCRMNFGRISSYYTFINFTTFDLYPKDFITIGEIIGNETLIMQSCNGSSGCQKYLAKHSGVTVEITFNTRYTPYENLRKGFCGSASMVCAFLSVCASPNNLYIPSNATEVIENPGHPNLYCYHMNCTWHVNTKPGWHFDVNVTFEKALGQRDSISFFNGNSTSANKRIQKCTCSAESSCKCKDFHSSSHTVTVRFMSGQWRSHSNNRGLFAIRFLSKKDACRNFTAPDSIPVKTGSATAQISTPGFPDVWYCSNKTYVWHLNAPLGYAVRTLLTKFEVALGDELHFYNGLQTDAASLLKRCGKMDKSACYCVESLNNTDALTLKFQTSETSPRAPGFQIQASAVKPSTCSMCESNPTDVSLDFGQTRDIFSPNWPDQFCSLIHNCSWTIRATDPYNRIYLSAESFNVPGKNAYLKIYNSKKSHSSFCTVATFEQYCNNVTSDGPTMGLEFYGDSCSLNYGFSFVVQAISNESLIQPTVSSPNQHAIVLGLSVGLSLLAILIILICSLCLWKRSQRKKRNSQLHQLRLTQNKSGERINDYLYETSCDHWEFSRSDVSVFEDVKLGSGAFGSVYKGEILTRILQSKQKTTASLFLSSDSPKGNSSERTTVAVKKTDPISPDPAKLDFLQEIEFMKSLGYSPHVLQMLGCVTKNEPYFLVVEFCLHGDLLGYLRKNQKEYWECSQDDRKMRTLVSFARQICDGMVYVNSKGHVHRDLAARNVLVDHNFKAKISDFGLCCSTDNGLYVAQSRRKLPFKWMAIESLKEHEFTIKSDVWSYGVVLYEIFSLGAVPYIMIQPADMLMHLEKGNRLEQPRLCSDRMYEIMMECFKDKPEDRPPFEELLEKLSTILMSAVEHYGYLELVAKRSFCDEVAVEENVTS